MSYWTKHSAQVTQRTSVDIRYHRTSASLFTSACHKRFMCVINVNTNVHIWRYPGSTARRSWTKLPLMPSSQIITPPVSIKARAAFIDNDLSHHYNEGNKRSLLSCIRYVDGARQSDCPSHRWRTRESYRISKPTFFIVTPTFNSRRVVHLHT